MERIQELINYFYIILPVGCAIKIIAVLIQIPMAQDKMTGLKRIKHTLVFMVAAFCIGGFFDMLTHYMGGI